MIEMIKIDECPTLIISQGGKMLLRSFHPADRGAPSSYFQMETWVMSTILLSDRWKHGMKTWVCGGKNMGYDFTLALFYHLT